MSKLNSRLVSFCITVAWAWAGSAAPAQAQSGADLIVTNAHIYTANERQPWADTMALKDGKIVAVGQGDLSHLAGRHTAYWNAGSRLIMPGFHDCHIHLEEGAVEQTQCRLNAAHSKQDALNLLRTYAEKTRQQKNWIIAVGLPLPALSGGLPLDHNFLDQAVSDKPLVVFSEDAHSCWLNTRAMQIAKLTAQSTAPCKGIIELDQEGLPTGCLREGAMALAGNAMPIVPLNERTRDLKEAVKLANSLGITSIQDAHATDEVLSTYAALAKKGELNVRVTAALHTGTLKTRAQLQRLERQRRQYSCGRLRVIAAKIFADGVIETRTAALLEPYADEPKSSGNLNYSEDELDAMVAELDKRGFQIHVHAIGDRAVRAALNSIEKAIQANRPWSRRHQLAHLELIHPDDLPRFAKLDVTANCQCLWAFQDPYINELTAPRLGERLKRVYPFGSLVAACARLAAGSDWTVSSMNPLEAMQVAVTRRSPVDGKGEPLNPDEAISLEQIVRAYTTGGAWVNAEESSTGSLECGKAADFIVLDQDIFKIAPEKIGQTKVICTLLDGKPVFGALPN